MEGLTVKTVSEQRPEEYQAENHPHIWREHVPGSENSEGKGPGAQTQW